MDKDTEKLFYNARITEALFKEIVLNEVNLKERIVNAFVFEMLYGRYRKAPPDGGAVSEKSQRSI